MVLQPLVFSGIIANLIMKKLLSTEKIYIETLTSLGTGHQVSLGLDDGDSVFLDWSGTSVATQGDVTHDNFPHVHIVELKQINPTLSVYSIFKH